MSEHKVVEAYIQRWGGGISHGGNERANLQMFVTELCTLLDLPQPDPAGSQRSENSYVFERCVTEQFADGGKTTRSLDLYRRGCFILEGKDTGKQTGSDGWDAAIDKARKQAENYVRAIPAEEGRPPFIIVADVGKSFALYSEFSRSGGNYVAFPDARSHKIPLEKLRDPDTRELLRKVWLEPLKLDPTRYAGKVTRAIADKLAKLAKSLEESGHKPEQVSGFLMRCLFTMFAEDVGLLPDRGFTALLEARKNNPATFHRQLEALWRTMNSGGFSESLDAEILKFNGGLFANATAIELNIEQIELLVQAAKADWRYVEPAIFGTLLERALNPRERHKLGAHYTPRAYVERLVLPTIIEPLRAEWAEVQAAALTYRQQRKTKEAVAEIRKFHHQLCQTRVLDPACGSGNFLYVTLEHMKRLEGEVLEVLGSLVKSGSFELEGLTVDPHQFLGMEINPRAAKIAEMVLWIGYLQWHFRTYGNVNPPEPVLRDFHNIEQRDALIAYETVELVTDGAGKPLTRWDGITYKTSPITGEPIPDESFQVEQYRYINPRKAEWPQADYIVGNPPFIGGWKMRSALGDGYVEAVWSLYPDIPQKADFVMYWWEIAAEKVRNSEAQRFGFITTNSITQVFQRRILERHLADKNAPLSLAFAIPDHPWVDASDGAAVRIAMTVGKAGSESGLRLNVAAEANNGSDEVEVQLAAQQGMLHPDLKIGANVASAVPLKASGKICSPGVQLYGSGFIIAPEKAAELQALTPAGTTRQVIRTYVNGRDLMQSSRGCSVIDFFGMSEREAREAHPPAFQHVLDHVKPERMTNRRESIRNLWWRFGWERPKLREMTAGLSRFICTPETARHRTFCFLTSNVLPDNKLTCIATDNAADLGVFSSRIHVLWSLNTGGRLGVGNDSVYNKVRCFETFPFPDWSAEQQGQIHTLAEQLDAHRKCQLAQYPELALTGVYNVLEKLRAGEELSVKEKAIHAQGLVSLLRELHDELDRAVFVAYGWDDLADKLVGQPGATTPLPDKSEAQAEAEEELLYRLVELNAQRAAEEARGQIRWLRPDYQNPNADVAPEQAEVELEAEETATKPAVKAKKLAWPKGMRDQIATLRSTLGSEAMTLEELSTRFTAPKSTTPLIIDALAALEELGMLYQEEDQYRLAG